MRHYLYVARYDEKEDVHICIDEEGKEHRIDLFVNGDLKGRNPKEIEDVKISVSYTYPYIEIGMGVELEGK
jgi:hypothetical protein